MSLSINDKTHIGNTIVTNAYFYATADKKKIFQLTQTISFDFIDEVIDKTGYIQIDTINGDIFTEIKNKITQTIDDVSLLNDYVQQILESIEETALQKNVNLDEKDNYIGIKSFEITVTYYFQTIIDYLESSIQTLNKLEEIYPMLENNPDFIQQVEFLIENISYRLSEIQSICTKGYEICEDYEKA